MNCDKSSIAAVGLTIIIIVMETQSYAILSQNAQQSNNKISTEKLTFHITHV